MSEILDEVLNLRESFKYSKYTKDDVLKALNSKNRSIDNFKALLSPAGGDMLESMATMARDETRARFGDNVSIFTPLYISNYCDSHCVYCGYSVKNKIKRAKLSKEQIKSELINIKKSGLEEILILTGESRTHSDVEYIGEACQLAREYFKVIGVEIYPVSTQEYSYLHECGVDYVNVYQETYSANKYNKVHLKGEKTNYKFRFNAQERALKGGMRGVGIAALLGLDDFRKDAFSAGVHAYLLSRKFPYAEISLSCPRLRPIINNGRINSADVGERELLQVIMAYRLFLPFATVVVSTRESANFRDNAIKIAVNKISAGVSVDIGGHTSKVGDEQFEIEDGRSVEAVCKSVKDARLYPLMSEYIYV
ncbi:MAG: 2-iminoacetate synthase ThiH [Campylobacter sp.]|nr:2-iminoacetate synthase ThiH [Campylobacter sp.]